MNNLRNTVRLIGKLGMDPEFKELTGDKKMARFSLATSETHKDKLGNKVTDTQWHNLVCWGKQAEIAGTYLQKGKEIAIEGKLVNRSYVDKEGNKKYVTEVVVNEIMMTGSKSNQ